MIAATERILGILALVAIVLALVSTVALVRRRIPGWLDVAALPTATAIAAVATGGSLFMSEVANYAPCTLCWYQRIAMYPLVIVLGVAALRGDRQVWRTSLPLAAIGAAVSIWHIAIENNPALGGACDPVAPCSIIWVREFGFLTLPTMALIGFVSTALLSLVVRQRAETST
ncbi:MAG: disulfide bond formation protein B [Nitriliruptoraceae bacterium]